MSDDAIIKAAKEAGLCFPDCWGLDRYLSSEDVKEDRLWVASAPNERELASRQEILDRANANADAQLKKLRRFAELLQQHK